MVLTRKQQGRPQDHLVVQKRVQHRVTMVQTVVPIHQVATGVRCVLQGCLYLVSRNMGKTLQNAFST